MPASPLSLPGCIIIHQGHVASAYLRWRNEHGWSYLPAPLPPPTTLSERKWRPLPFSLLSLNTNKATNEKQKQE